MLAHLYSSSCIGNVSAAFQDRRVLSGNTAHLQGALNCVDGPLCPIPCLACKLYRLVIDILGCACYCLPCLLEGSTCMGTGAIQITALLSADPSCMQVTSAVLPYLQLTISLWVAYDAH